MRRLVLAAIALAMSIAFVVALARTTITPAFADLDPKACSSQSQVFTSPDRVRMVIPRGWCATDYASYPGLLVSMLRNQPPGEIMLTSEAFTRELYCSWPLACRNQPTNTERYACALRMHLLAGHMHVGPTQLGPKENEQNGLPSVWFEYDDGKRFLRQAVAMTQDRAISLVLTAPTHDARATHVRPFDQALRTLRILTKAQVANREEPEAPADAGSGSSAAPAAPSRPASISPIGPCPTGR